MPNSSSSTRLLMDMWPFLSKTISFQLLENNRASTILPHYHHRLLHALLFSIHNKTLEPATRKHCFHTKPGHIQNQSPGIGPLLNSSLLYICIYVLCSRTYVLFFTHMYYMHCFLYCVCQSLASALPPSPTYILSNLEVVAVFWKKKLTIHICFLL